MSRVGDFVDFTAFELKSRLRSLTRGPALREAGSRVAFEGDVRAIPVFYINLDHREDRRRQAETLWRDTLGMHCVTRVPGVLDEPPYRGCTKAHLAALDAVRASAPDAPFVIVAEDDPELLPGATRQALFARIASALTDLPDLDVLLLAASLHNFEATPIDGVVRLKRRGALAMPAVVVRQGYLSGLGRIYEFALSRDRPLDRFTMQAQKSRRWYALEPPLMRQASGYSDIERRYVDYEA